MQVFGAVGLTPDTPLAWMWSWGRALRFMDGPDEVHLRAVARQELVQQTRAPRRKRAAPAAAGCRQTPSATWAEPAHSRRIGRLRQTSR
jgi:hypothetical protein